VNGTKRSAESTLLWLSRNKGTVEHTAKTQKDGEVFLTQLKKIGGDVSRVKIVAPRGV
jgi:hypothetical protein